MGCLARLKTNFYARRCGPEGPIHHYTNSIHFSSVYGDVKVSMTAGALQLCYKCFDANARNSIAWALLNHVLQLPLLTLFQVH